MSAKLDAAIAASIHVQQAAADLIAQQAAQIASLKAQLVADVADDATVTQLDTANQTLSLAIGANILSVADVTAVLKA